MSCYYIQAPTHNVTVSDVSGAHTPGPHPPALMHSWYQELRISEFFIPSRPYSPAILHLVGKGGWVRVGHRSRQISEFFIPFKPHRSDSLQSVESEVGFSECALPCAGVACRSCKGNQLHGTGRQACPASCTLLK